MWGDVVGWIDIRRKELGMGLRKKKSLVDQASDYVDAMRPHVESALESAGGFVRDTALPALSDARDKAGPALAEAREKAAPVIADARVKAAVGLAEAREKAAPIVAQGAAIAAERATAAREVADAKVAQLTGAPAPKKKSKLKRFVLVAGLAGGVAAVAKKLQGGGAGADNWQSTYTPAPAPARTLGATDAVGPAGRSRGGFRGRLARRGTLGRRRGAAPGLHAR